MSFNIFLPPNATGSESVLVWIHGGSLSSGGSAEKRIYGVNLAKQGIIVVTLNYRLGVLGFLAYDGLETQGSFGIEDQQMALAIVRKTFAQK